MKNMNENLDLRRILKNCPKGWKFYTSVWGEVEFIGFSSESVDFLFNTIVGNIVDVHINTDGTYCGFGECIIFPSKEEALNKKIIGRYIDTIPIKWEE